jgi:hypothetical protein
MPKRGLVMGMGRLHSGGQSYAQRVLALGPVAYWPLDDAAGSAAARELVVGTAATATDVTFGAAGIGDGKTAATFNGTSSSVNIYSAALNAAFSGQLFSFFCWGRRPTDATYRVLAALRVDSSNEFAFHKNAGNQPIFIYVAAGRLILSPTPPSRCRSIPGSAWASQSASPPTASATITTYAD